MLDSSRLRVGIMATPDAPRRCFRVNFGLIQKLNGFNRIERTFIFTRLADQRSRVSSKRVQPGIDALTTHQRLLKTHQVHSKWPWRFSSKRWKVDYSITVGCRVKPTNAFACLQWLRKCAHLLYGRTHSHRPSVDSDPGSHSSFRHRG